MKPFPGKKLTTERRNFNYRLSRARRTSENACGISSSKFRIFKHPILTSPKNVQKIIFATAVPHNFLQESCTQEEAENRVQCHGNEREMREENCAIQDLPRVPRNPSAEAKNVRENFKEYFANEGKVPWQDKMALLH